MNFKKIFMLAAAGIAVVGTSAKSPVQIQSDSIKESHKIIFFGEGQNPSRDSIRTLVDAFYYDQFRHFQDPRAPYFMFMSRDAQLAMGIGGRVKMRGWYDWGGAQTGRGFIPYNIAMTDIAEHRRNFGTSPAGSALFFKILGTHSKIGNYQLYIEANFTGYGSRDFKLKKAYATINDWTVGYANSTFSDPSAQPPTIDSQGPNIEISATSTLVRWMHSFKKHWVVAVSVEDPDIQIGSNGTQTATIDKWFPDVAAFGQYEWGNGEHVRLAGIMRVLPYRDLVAQKNHNIMGWGLHLSTVFNPVDPVTIYGSLCGGRGISSLTGDLSCGNFDLVNNPDAPGKMYSPYLFGWYGAVQYNFRPNIFASFTFGQETYLPSHSVAPDTYKYGYYSALNVLWDITPRIQVGAEFNLGKRENFDRDHKWGRRAGLMAQFSF